MSSTTSGDSSSESSSPPVVQTPAEVERAISFAQAPLLGSVAVLEPMSPHQDAEQTANPGVSLPSAEAVQSYSMWDLDEAYAHCQPMSRTERRSFGSLLASQNPD